MERYDLVVIGSGPAGEKGAAQAAYFGKRMAMIEREPYVGGAGINTGTVPSKTLRETALYFSGLAQRGDGAERVLHGDVILIATGSVPTRAKDIPFADPRVHDSDEILTMERLPATLAVIGAGVIGCEYATMFAALGITVTLIDGRDRLLAFLDVEMASRLSPPRRWSRRGWRCATPSI